MDEGADLPEVIECFKKHRRRQNRLWKNQPPTGGREQPEIDIGHRIRCLRTDRNLTLRLLAERSGLNINTLSLIENNRTSPSVATLQQLAGALGVPITSFFKMEAEKESVVFSRAGRRPQIAFANGFLEELGGCLAGGLAEPFLLRLNPQGGSGSNPVVHTGLEFIYCLEGVLTYTIGSETYILKPGDSLFFEAHLPHRWHNAGEETSCSLLVLCPKDENDQPIEFHFATSGLD